MTGAEELIWAAEYVRARATPEGLLHRDYALRAAKDAVQALREAHAGAPANQNAYQRMLAEFRDGS